ncbi:MAG: DUF4381 domain-containing protein [Acidobacteria bacterium]|nr:DUF4381 domain-containing protein [Acidobacteriota bacterium]
MTSPDQPAHLAGPQALSDLADISVPDPVGWYPPAWGWWALGGLLLVALLALAARRIRRHVRDRYRREALAECAALLPRLDDENERAAALAAMAAILKRTALAAWPRPEVASLAGRPWVEFLRQNAGRARLDEPIAALLDAAEYRPASLAEVSREDARSCARSVRAWIEDHHVPA